MIGSDHQKKEREGGNRLRREETDAMSDKKASRKTTIRSYSSVMDMT